MIYLIYFEYELYLHPGLSVDLLQMKLNFPEIALIFSCLVLSLNTSADEPLLKNEVLIFSFDTKTSKHVLLAKDSTDKYIIYRFSNKDKIEMEFPDMTNNSWKKFKYSFYLRGGGLENDGLDLNYVFFENENYRYVIYQTYSAADSESNIGVKVIDIKTNKTSDIPGNPKTRKGTLIDFRDNGLLQVGDEIFD